MDESLHRVLVVDDEKPLLLGLKTTMERAGYQVMTAGNGAEALHLVQSYRPDIIISDVMMPPPNGFELRKILSQDQDTAAIPFIFLTARTSQSDKLFGLNLEVDDYITKPFDRQELVARVQAILRRVQLSRQSVQAEAQNQIDRLRREIIQNVSHELRTPLAVVLMNLDVILGSRLEQDPQQVRQYISSALSSANHLRRLVDDLIIVSSLDQDKFNPLREEIDLKFEFYTPIEECLQYWAEKKTLKPHFNVASDLTLYGPKLEFRQAVHHLVDNACKFSPDGGQIEIILTGNNAGGFILTVSDQGPGIPADQREKVFERYYQISQGTTRLADGLGIGLTIVRTVARYMGGDAIVIPSDTGCRVGMITKFNSAINHAVTE